MKAYDGESLARQIDKEVCVLVHITPKDELKKDSEPDRVPPCPFKIPATTTTMTTSPTTPRMKMDRSAFIYTEEMAPDSNNNRPVSAVYEATYGARSEEVSNIVTRIDMLND